MADCLKPTGVPGFYAKSNVDLASCKTGYLLLAQTEYSQLLAAATQPPTSPPDTSPGSGGNSSGVSAGVSAFIVVCVGMFFMGYMTRVVLKSVIRFFNGSPDDF